MSLTRENVGNTMIPFTKFQRKSTVKLRKYRCKAYISIIKQYLIYRPRLDLDLEMSCRADPAERWQN